MFERYDERARRTLFFARYEASRLGVSSIEPEHLLLGLMREPRGHAGRLLLALPQAETRRELEGDGTREKIALSVEIPFSPQTKIVLHHASDEADGMAHSYIGAEHLFLGLLRESQSRAATIMAQYGLTLEGAREEIRESCAAGAARPVPMATVLTQLDHIIESAHQFSMSLSGNSDAAHQVHMLLLELESMKSLLNDQE